MGALLLIILTVNVILFATILQPYVFNNKRIGGGKVSTLLGPSSGEESSQEGKVPPNMPGKPPGINGELVAGVYGSGLSHIVVGHLLMGWIYVIAPGLSVLLVLFTLLWNTDFSYLHDPDPYNLQSLQHELDPLLPPPSQGLAHNYPDFSNHEEDHFVQQVLKVSNGSDYYSNKKTEHKVLGKRVTFLVKAKDQNYKGK